MESNQHADTIRTSQRKEGFPAVDPVTPSLREQSAICGDCGMTVLKQHDSARSYWCIKCQKAHDKSEVIR